MKIRTMRDIPTIQGLRGQITPATREQAVTEMARLEHELARLKRELGMWIDNQTKTTERMHRIEQRLTMLKEILDPGMEGAAEQRSHRSDASENDRDEGQGKSKGWKTIPFQY
jgi:predicted  nucleic acid-binding Zn-ribbon protein